MTPEAPFDSAACGGHIDGIAATIFDDDLAIGLSVQNEFYGMFGVIIPVTNYSLRVGDHITVLDGIVYWLPRIAADHIPPEYQAMLTREFPALRIVKIGGVR
jgi:hypothetical protein